jgi:hypothetical protein
VHEDRRRATAGERVLDRRHLVGLELEAVDAEVFEAPHHRSHPFVERCAPRAGPEHHVGLDPGELEDVVDHAVVLAGRDDDRLVVLALAQREDDRHQLDRLGPRADDDRHDECRIGWDSWLGHPRRLSTSGTVGLRGASRPRVG